MSDLTFIAERPTFQMATSSITVSANTTANLALANVSRTDSFGYTCTDGAATYIAGTTATSLSGDDNILQITMPFAVTLYEWCDPIETPRTRGLHTRRPISEFSMHLATNYADRVRAALRPQTRLLRELVAGAADAGVVRVTDVRDATARADVLTCHSRSNRGSWLADRIVSGSA